jgi:hypothetical protein
MRYEVIIHCVMPIISEKSSAPRLQRPLGWTTSLAWIRLPLDDSLPFKCEQRPLVQFRHGGNLRAKIGKRRSDRDQPHREGGK